MTDLEHILPLWQELERAGAEYVLATVVEVQGSSYRRPGARMLLAADGRRAGTVSGGCLEAEVAKKAWWLTERGPVIERYSTLEDDGDLPYGSGCGGVIFILLERSATARPLLEALHAAWSAREPLAIATVLEGPHIGPRVFAGSAPALSQLTSWQANLEELACAAFEERKPREERIAIDGTETRIWVDYRTARPGLWIFGAGDDAKPLHNLARELGWFVAIADGRTHLATAQRFPAADIIVPLHIENLHRTAPAELDLHPGDAAVLATHSYEQDTHILAFLLSRALERRPNYIGILGPQRRTREALVDAARLLGLTPTTALVDEWLEQINGPTGLDLGADTPASIALSILAEIQKSLTAASALPLKQVRAMRPVESQR
ncbi:XdhC family protein [Occallatibacter riparius]|uniref:XdhC family protein n=1 Tax=Occallatibacter riparius TaxID=1002689 RepID=A0A9J7BPK9_9BACT|nr:XdhC/CoxI family protein [Occallatibacter riparius]UWZ83682.1 XdhC family protein [Occallatibacter riparius]